MTGRVDELDGDVAHADLVAAAVLDQVESAASATRFTHSASSACTWIGTGWAAMLPARRRSGTSPCHRRRGRGGGGEAADQAHAVGVQQLEDVLHAVGGVDDNGVTRLAVADEVDEAGTTLAGERIAGGDVPPREQLLEVEAVLVHGGSGYAWIPTAPDAPEGVVVPACLGPEVAWPARWQELRGQERIGLEVAEDGRRHDEPRRQRGLIAPLEGGHQGRHLGPQPPASVAQPSRSETGQARGVLTDVGSKGSALGGHYVTVAG